MHAICNTFGDAVAPENPSKEDSFETEFLFEGCFHFTLLSLEKLTQRTEQVWVLHIQRWQLFSWNLQGGQFLDWIFVWGVFSVGTLLTWQRSAFYNFWDAWWNFMASLCARGLQHFWWPLKTFWHVELSHNSALYMSENAWRNFFQKSVFAWQ